jgi:hypothetical protein
MAGYVVNGSGSDEFEQRAGTLTQDASTSSYVFLNRAQATRYARVFIGAEMTCFRGLLSGYQDQRTVQRIVGSRPLSLPRVVQQQGAIALHTRIIEKQSGAAIADAYYEIAELRQGRTTVSLVYVNLGSDDQAGMISFAETVALRMKRDSR